MLKMQLLIKIAICLIGVGAGNAVYANVLTAQEREFFQASVAKPMSLKMFLFTYASAGASSQELINIGTDYKARISSITDNYKIGFENDKLFVDDIFSGVIVRSYNPLQYNIQGQVWSYQISKSIEENYFSLMKMLDERKSASLISTLISDAHADGSYDRVKKSSQVGAGLGGWFGLSLLKETGNITLSRVVWGTAFYSGAGALAGAGVGLAANQFFVVLEDMRKAIDPLNPSNQVVSKIARSKDSLFMCSTDRFAAFSTIEGMAQVILDKSKNEFVAMDLKNKKKIEMPELVKRQYYTLAKNCNSEADAKKLTEKVRTAALAAERAGDKLAKAQISPAASTSGSAQ